MLSAKQGTRRMGRSVAARKTSRKRDVLRQAVETCMERLEQRQLLSANAIAINFTGGGNGGSTPQALAATAVAGVIPVANYNNVDGGNTTTSGPIALNNSTGAASGATLAFTSGGIWSSAPGSVTPATPDQQLNDGFVFGDGDFTISNIPYANYDVYVYELNDGSRGQVTTEVQGSAPNTAFYLNSPNPTDANHVSGAANNYQYIAGTSTNMASPTPNGDFVVFGGNSTSTFEFKNHALTSNGFINGIEIVDHTSTAPVVATPVAGNSTVQLSWTYGNSSANGFTYSVYRTDAAHPTPNKIATGLTTQTYADNTAVNGTTYTYYVTADNAIGPSGNSNSVTATPASAVPPQVTGLTGSRTNASTVALTWNPALGATSYIVTRGTSLNMDGSVGGTTTTATVNTNSDTDTSATGAFYYSVTPVNSAGNGPASSAFFVGAGEGWDAAYYMSDQANQAVWSGDQVANQNLVQPDGTFVPLTDTQPPATTQPNNAVLGFRRLENNTINTPANNDSIAPAGAPAGWNAIEPGQPGHDFATRWEGYVTPSVTGYYTFFPGSDDGISVTVINTPGATPATGSPVTLQPDQLYHPRGFTTDTVPVTDVNGNPVLWTEGQKYYVQVDYNNGGGGWQAELQWAASSSTANQTAGTYDALPEQVLPPSQVVSPAPQFQTVDAANPTGQTKDDTSGFYSMSVVGGNNVLAVSWPNINADSYNLYKSTTPINAPDPSKLLATVPANTGGPVTYNDTAVTNGTTYYYLVTATNNSGTSGPLTGHGTPVAGAPAAPTNLSATRTDANTVALTWTGAQFATSYDVKRGTALDMNGNVTGTVTDLTPGGISTTSFTDTNATQRTTWYYQVTASNSGGTSPPSTAASVQSTFVFGVGAPPTDAISVNMEGGNFGNPSPLDPTDVAGVVPEANYNNEMTTATGTDTNLHDGTGTGLGTTVTWTGGGPWNSVGNPFTPATPDQKLNWGFLYGNGQQNPGEDFQLTNIPFSNYDVYVYELNDGSREQSTVDTSNPSPTTYYLVSPNPASAGHESGVVEPYQYVQATSTDSANPTQNADYVKFSNETGANFEFQTDTMVSNGFVNGFQIVFHPTSPPASPVLNTPTTTSNSINLTWNNVPHAWSYTVFRTDAAHPTPTVIATDVATNSYSDTTAVGGVTYTYTVAADNPAGESAPSNPESATITASNITLNSVAFTDGSTNVNQTQRSEVREIALTFSGPVTLGTGAVTLAQLNTGGSGKNDGSAPTNASAALGTPTSPDGGTTWVIPIAKSTAFSDNTGSLVDGIYTVTVDPTKVTGGTLTGTNLSTTFHRLFGDITGGKTVNNGDYLKFKQAYLTSTGNPKFNADFDYDANGTINNADFLQFKKRYLKVFTY